MLDQFHAPVLLGEISRLAKPRRRAVDCTAGGGGHAAALAEAGLQVLAFDRDLDAVEAASRRLAPLGATVTVGKFGDEQVQERILAFRPDLILLDLGVSSHQLDDEGRGFSFRQAVPLDMRMDRSEGRTAAELLNCVGEQELAGIFTEYGDERRGRRLAREIVRRRKTVQFATSDHLVGAVRAVLGPRSGPPDFARIFQAVRIAVNEELSQLNSALPKLRDALEPGGVIAVISYHSGEDRLVKRAFAEWARECVCPPHQPLCTCRGEALGSVETRKPIVAGPDEVAANVRARSAKLRVFRRGNDG